MEIRGKLTQEESDQLYKLTIPFLGLNLPNLLLVMLATILVMGPIHKAFDSRESWTAIGITWAICLTAMMLLLRAMKRWRRQAHTRTVEALPQSYSVEESGITSHFANAIYTFYSWPMLSKFWFNGNFLFVQRIKVDDPLILPLTGALGADVEFLEEIMKRHLVEASTS